MRWFKIELFFIQFRIGLADSGHLFELLHVIIWCSGIMFDTVFNFFHTFEYIIYILLQLATNNLIHIFKKMLQVSDSNLIDWLNFTVFLNAWNLSSHELVHPDRNERRPIIWDILDSLLKKYISEKVSSMEPQICSPCGDIQLLMQLVTEPLAWHGLVIQSCLRSCLPSSKKKKKSGPAYQSSSNLAHAITDSVQQLSLVLEGVMKRISEWNRKPEDENSEGILSLLRKDEHNDGPGRVFHVLETFISSMSNAEVGDRIYHSLKSWSPADVAKKMMTGKLKVLTEFSAICESKLKLLQSLKQQIAQV